MVLDILIILLTMTLLCKNRYKSQWYSRYKIRGDSLPYVTAQFLQFFVKVRCMFSHHKNLCWEHRHIIWEPEFHLKLQWLCSSVGLSKWSHGSWIWSGTTVLLFHKYLHIQVFVRTLAGSLLLFVEWHYKLNHCYCHLHICSINAD